jgi:hypothetical protein
MTYARSQDARSMHVFEDHMLRCILLSFTRAAHAASKKDYEEKLHALHRRIVRSKSNKRRYNYLSRLAELIRRFVIDTRMVVGLMSISSLPGLQEFCQFLQPHPWLREQWEPMILSCTCESWSIWVEKIPRRPDFTILEIATEQWEWSCFRHYRDSFVHWAFYQNPCGQCVDELRQMARRVDYDRVEVAVRNYNPTTSFLNCVSRLVTRCHNIASLEPFIMILRQKKNARWLAWWAPFIHMQTDCTVAEICQIYNQNSRAVDGIDGAISAPTRIANTMFEHRGLQNVVESIQRERVLVDARIAQYRRRQNTRNEAAFANPGVNRA